MSAELEAARAVLDRKREAWHEERDRHARAVAEAYAGGYSLAGNHWHAVVKAREQLKTAKALVAILKELAP